MPVMPAVNMWEDEKAYHVEAELPGISEKDLSISVLGNELRIEGGREEENVEEKKNYLRRERSFGKFSRILRFPVDLEDSKAEAKYENGILHLTLPKAAAALPRKVAVKVV
jgi:HSP20 family protein